MDSEINFESYLFIGQKKLIISVIKKKNFENIYKKEISHEYSFNRMAK